MLVIKDTKFNVSIERKAIRNMYIRVKGNDVEVTAPYRVPEYEIYRFIESKKSWIYKVYLRGMEERNTMLYRGGDEFYVFGERYHLSIDTGKDSISIANRDIHLTYHDDDKEKQLAYLYKYFDREVFKQSCLALDKYRAILDDYHYPKMPEITVKRMKSRWGVCYTRQNRIAMSSYLIHYPIECLEYIMVHELTHFVVPNHSKRFYEIVGNYMPDYKKRNELLK